MTARPAPTSTIAGAGADGQADARLVELILARVRLRARRRVAWLVHLGARPPGADGFDPSLAACLDDRDTPDAEAAWHASDREAAELGPRIDAIERALAGPAGGRQARLAGVFGLEATDLDVLHATIAVHLDPALGSVYAWLQRHPARTYATAPLVARLFGHGHRLVHTAALPIASWEIVVAGEAPPGEPQPLAADPHVLSWLQGHLHLDAALVGAVRDLPRHEPLDGWPVDATVERIRTALVRGDAVRVLVAGPPGSGRRSFAAAVGARLGMRTLGVDTQAIAEARWSSAWVRAQRLAILGRAILVWHGEELHRRWPTHLAIAPVQFVAHELGQSVAPSGLAIDHKVELPAPGLAVRRALWLRHATAAPSWGADLDVLAARHRLSPGDIERVARRAPAGAAQAAELCREISRDALGELGQLLDCPFGWTDLVIADGIRATLADFAYEARERAAVWDEPAARRLFPRGTGLVALLTGPPGTGKTMAAQIIAAELDLDLIRIDLASVVSKYIGETAKNLRRVFARAARMSAVLLFDEADALFSRRTDVRDSLDRHANTDTGYLLQLLEDYQGVAFLATNRKGDLDPAFIRRMRYVVDVPPPDPHQRRQIWRQVVAGLFGVPAADAIGDRGLDALTPIELSGAQIKNAAVAALFAARRLGEPLATTHLLRGIDRELGKEGRAVSKRDRERLSDG